MSHRDAILRVLRASAVVVLVVLVVGGIPGASSRAVLHDLVAPPVPLDVKDRDGVLDVTVHDGAGGLPLAAAHVRALALVEGRAYLADAHDTDGAGMARLTRLPHGEAWVLADAPGKARGSTRLVVEAGTARRSRSTWRPSTRSTSSVTDDVGHAVPGAEVEVTGVGRSAPGGRARSGDGARARRAARRGAVARDRAGARGSRRRARAPSHDGEAVHPRLRKLGAIAVHVVGADGEAAADARVAVAGAMLWPARSAQADAGGDVRIGGLAAGMYALRATAGDRVSPIELGVLARTRRGEGRRAAPRRRALGDGAGHRRRRRRRATRWRTRA